MCCIVCVQTTCTEDRQTPIGDHGFGDGAIGDGAIDFKHEAGFWFEKIVWWYMADLCIAEFP
jgi:hypothetical protein